MEQTSLNQSYGSQNKSHNCEVNRWSEVAYLQVVGVGDKIVLQSITSPHPLLFIPLQLYVCVRQLVQGVHLSSAWPPFFFISLLSSSSFSSSPLRAGSPSPACWSPPAAAVFVAFFTLHKIKMLFWTSPSCLNPTSHYCEVKWWSEAAYLQLVGVGVEALLSEQPCPGSQSCSRHVQAVKREPGTALAQMAVLVVVKWSYVDTGYTEKHNLCTYSHNKSTVVQAQQRAPNNYNQTFNENQTFNDLTHYGLVMLQCVFDFFPHLYIRWLAPLTAESVLAWGEKKRGQFLPKEPCSIDTLSQTIYVFYQKMSEVLYCTVRLIQECINVALN